MTSNSNEIEQRLHAVKERIAKAAWQAGRNPAEVQLIAVSKTHGTEAIRAAYHAGQRHFGENYLQELAAKQDALADLPDIIWHFIGTVQSRKSPELVRRRLRVHGLDSASAVRRLGAAAQAAGIRLPVLMQINLAAEDSKSGVSRDSAMELGALLAETPSLDWRGLMTIPPVGSIEDTRHWFRALRQLRDEMSGNLKYELPELSMGMSGDFETAISEGSTWVRVGTAIFGER